MCRFLERLTGGYKSRAHVAGNKLVLSFPDAISPCIWQMDITSAAMSAVELESTPDGIFALVFKDGKKTTETIAKFASRAKAVRALMHTSEAIEGGLNHISPGSKNAATAPSVIIQKPSFIGSIFKGVFVTIAVILVLGFLILFGVNALIGPNTNLATQQSLQSNSAQQPAGNAVGVPMSADDFLKGK